MKMLKYCLAVSLVGLMLFSSASVFASSRVQGSQERVSLSSETVIVLQGKSAEDKDSLVQKPPKEVSKDKPAEIK